MFRRNTNSRSIPRRSQKFSHCIGSRYYLGIFWIWCIITPSKVQADSNKITQIKAKQLTHTCWEIRHTKNLLRFVSLVKAIHMSLSNFTFLDTMKVRNFKALSTHMQLSLICRKTGASYAYKTIQIW